MELDVYDLCSDDLRKKLEGPRQVPTCISKICINSNFYHFSSNQCLSSIVVLIFNFHLQKQILRDEEGKKLGLKASGKGSTSKDTDVKMSEAEVSTQPSYKPSHTKLLKMHIWLYILTIFHLSSAYRGHQMEMENHRILNPTRVNLDSVS